MIAVRGRVQREGEVVHLVAHRIVDLSRDLASVGQREMATAEQQGPEAGGIRVKARDFR
jgi:error-prone DNA polymerase